MMIKRALLSVSDKTGIVSFAQKLTEAGYEILSTGGTMKELQKAKIKATSVEDFTGFPECFGGRVKTMHPKIMGGILFNREIPEHAEQAKKLGIEPIDLVVVNLYPFAETVEVIRKNSPSDQPDSLAGPARAGKSEKPNSHSSVAPEAIEQIDIGGPTLLRSAAKNHDAVTVICDPADYDEVVSQIQKNGSVTAELRMKLAAKVFAHTAAYDGMIADYFSAGNSDSLILTKGRTLRYGENPHQWGKFYEVQKCKSAKVNSEPWKQEQGKDLSYLNILDADACWRMVCEYASPTCVMVKHANPSGIASAASIEDAFQAAYDSDRLSAFGVIIGLNRPCSAAIAQKILDQKIFVEVILAPEYESGALELLKTKPNIRLISLALTPVPSPEMVLYRSAFGGMLVQNDDTKEITEADLTCVTKIKPTKKQIEDLLFAWKVVKHAKSNAIVLAKDSTTVGIGCGQTSRVDSTWIALKRAGEKAKGSVLASDAFFPFPDSIEEAAKHGISAVIQPGGSIRDSEVFAKADELGIAMVVTGVRAFRH